MILFIPKGGRVVGVKNKPGFHQIQDKVPLSDSLIFSYDLVPINLLRKCYNPQLLNAILYVVNEGEALQRKTRTISLPCMIYLVKSCILCNVACFSPQTCILSICSREVQICKKYLRSDLCNDFQNV